MRALGLDVSVYDAPIDLTKATKEIDFIIMRTSYGLKSDEQYNANLQSISKVPIRGAYHYYSTAVPWQNQADFFLEKATGFHFLAVDYEQAYNNLGLSSAIGLRNMLDYLLTKASKVLLYTNVSIYQNLLNPYADFSKYDLWLAQYPYTIFLNLNGNPRMPQLRKTWTFWQYGADTFGTAGYGVGRSYGVHASSVDLDVFNGTVDDLRSYVGNVMPPVPNPVVVQHKYVVLVPVLNVRNAPITGSIVGALYKGNIVSGDPVSIAGSGTWLKMARGTSDFNSLYGYAAIVGASGTPYMQDTSVNVGGSGY